jgi:hypothetical protein
MDALNVPEAARTAAVGYSHASIARHQYSTLAALVLATMWLAAPVSAQHADTDAGVRVRALAAGWGTAWAFGVPGWGKTISDVRCVAFHPGLGWFVTRRTEVFGEAALFIYSRPSRSFAVGPVAVGARHQLRGQGRLRPFVGAGAGLIVTPLDVVELDRAFNGQLFYGGGVRWLRPRGPHWRVEFRNHHISNAGTAGDNLGLNAFMVIVGAEWLARDRKVTPPSAGR